GTLLVSIAPQQSRFDPPQPTQPQPILGPTREMSDEPNPIHSPAPTTSALRARPGSSVAVARLGQTDSRTGDKAPAPAKPPPLNTSSSFKRQRELKIVVSFSWSVVDKSRKKAMKDLVQSWMDRLQLISVITTFFAATEAQLLGITVPSDDGTPLRPVEQAANAGLAGALVIHVFAAILSFFAAFFLIRYRLREAKREESKVEEGSPEKSTDSHSIFSANPHLDSRALRAFPPRQPPDSFAGELPHAVYVAERGRVRARAGGRAVLCVGAPAAECQYLRVGVYVGVSVWGCVCGGRVVSEAIASCYQLILAGSRPVLLAS
ncbi:hypothetical protein EUX98_g8456, partial [Antrodiella citrinella]